MNWSLWWTWPVMGKWCNNCIQTLAYSIKYMYITCTIFVHVKMSVIALSMSPFFFNIRVHVYTCSYIYKYIDICVLHTHSNLQFLFPCRHTQLITNLGFDHRNLQIKGIHELTHKYMCRHKYSCTLLMWFTYITCTSKLQIVLVYVTCIN